jgi:Mn2+/Fe2+ NRAMP family transporter
LTHPTIEALGISEGADLAEDGDEHFLDQVLTVVVGAQEGADLAVDLFRVAGVEAFGCERLGEGVRLARGLAHEGRLNR